MRLPFTALSASAAVMVALTPLTTADAATPLQVTVTGFDAAPEPVAYTGTVTGRGQILIVREDGSRAPAPYASFRLQFSTDKKSWSNKSALTSTDEQGRFTATGTAYHDGYWRVAVQGDGSDYATTAGPSDYVDVRYLTRILDYNASPEPVRKGGTVTLQGMLYRYTDKWHHFVQQKMYFYFRPKGSTKWTYLGSARGDRNGLFRKGFKATKSGTWRAYYPGSASYAKVYRDDYVNLR
ncbi:hypothetical protein [Actinomadura terrae]|uniref:hypothetical protein n=1 Tax=Actinomadura terrae TaxID=604353 RepID=UPI001FA78237|nr:hypothetical protein [Actinomadura terrae]